jgi:hypothetical protein
MYVILRINGQFISGNGTVDHSLPPYIAVELHQSKSIYTVSSCLCRANDDNKPIREFDTDSKSTRLPSENLHLERYK